MNPRTTLKQVAAEAGVSPSTACRVLSGYPKCSEEARRRVKEAAERLGYRRDPMLSALVAHRDAGRNHKATCNLALVSEEVADATKVWDRYLSLLYRQLGEHCYRRGYSLELYTPSEQSSPKALARMLRARGVQGIIWGWLFDPSYLEEFPWESFCHIGFLLPVVRPQIHRVRDDAFRTMMDTMEEVFRKGFTRPGLALYTSVGSENDRFKQAGWLQAHAEHSNRTPLPIWKSTHAAEQSLEDWFEEHRPDILVGNNNAPFHALRESGYSLPEETPFICMCHPGRMFPYPGFDCSEDEIARSLVSLLDARLQHNEYGLTDTPTTLLVRRHFLGWDSGKSV